MTACLRRRLFRRRFFAARRPDRRRAARPLALQRLEPRALLSATVDNLDLVADTGYRSDDRLTSLPEVSGEVTWEDGDADSVRVEWDHHGDGVVESTLDVSDPGEWFSYDPLAVEAALNNWDGSFSLWYRTVEILDGEETPGPWQEFAMVLDRVAPEVTSTTPADGATANQDITFAAAYFNEPVDTDTLDPAAVFIESTATGEQPPQTLAPVNSYEIHVNFDAGSLPAGPYTTVVNSVRDLAGNEVTGVEANWTLNATPTTIGIPDVTVAEDSPPTIIELPEFFSDNEQPGNTLDYDVVANTNESLFASVDIDPVTSELTLEYAEDAYGFADLTVRATDANGAYVETTFRVTVTPVNDAPEITSFYCVEGALSWTFYGQVVDETPGALTVTFGGILEGHTALTNADGSFVLVVPIGQSGLASAVTTDPEGLVSNTAYHTP